MLPSKFYPDYFKLDFQVGGPQESELTRSVDTVCAGLSILGQKLGHSLKPHLFRESDVRRSLEYFGFATETLSSDESDAFFDSVIDIFKNRCSLHAIKRLANVYFANPQIRRGRPYPKGRMDEEGVHQLSLCESDDENTVVFVRLSTDCLVSRIDEFKRNCELIIPKGFSVEIAPPLCQLAEKANGIQLSGVMKLAGRRL
jgi:hypothetical protein